LAILLLNVNPIPIFAPTEPGSVSSTIAGNLNSFAIIVGKCVWVPPSAKAAALFVAYFFGTVPGLLSEVYEHDLAQQFVAAGMTAEGAGGELRWLNDCIGTYVVPPQNKGTKTSINQTARAEPGGTVAAIAVAAG
jgi:hypothetical protein